MVAGLCSAGGVNADPLVDACPFSTILCLINQLSEEATKEHQSSTRILRQENALYSSCLRYVASNLSIFNCYGIWRDLLIPS